MFHTAPASAFGAGYLIDVLLGRTEDERIARFGHDRTSTFGIGSEFTRPEWQNIVRQLVALNLFYADNAEHGGLRITDRGHAFLKSREPLQLRKFTGKAKSSTSKTRAALNFDDEEDESLFNALKAARLELAREQNVAAFVIFHDKTLHEIAMQRPRSLHALYQIGGIGQAKIERYGKAIIETVEKHASGAEATLG